MAMTAQSTSWEQVGAKFDVIGTRLRHRLDQVSADAAADRAALEQAMQALVAAVEDTVTAAGKLVADAELRQDITAFAASVREALLGTVERAGESIRGQVSPSAIRTRSTTAVRRLTAREGAPVKPVARAAAVRKPAVRKPAVPTPAGTKPVQKAARRNSTPV
jgi:hypothetical protein